MNPHLPSDSPLPSAFFHTDALPTGTVRPSAEAAVPTDIHTHRLPEQPGSAVVTVDPTTEGGLPEHQCCSVGIHPWHTDGDWERTGMPRVERLAGEDRVVAIGECGLDKVWLKRLPAGERDGAFRRQTEAFEAHIRLSEATGKPLIIHCVRAYNELVLLHRKHRPRQTWVVHGFRGNRSVARQLLDEGLSLSFGEHFQTEALLATPDGRLFVETDESPKPLADILAAVATARGTDPEVLVRVLENNYRRLHAPR